MVESRVSSMGGIKEGGSIVRPPLFDGTSYDYWKMRMTSFIRSVEEAAWSFVEMGWKEPMDEEGNKKPHNKWTPDELKDT